MKTHKRHPALLFAATTIIALMLTAAVPSNVQNPEKDRLNVITFPETPSVEQLEALEEAGIRLGEYLGNGSYYVRMSGAERLALPASVHIREALPRDKYRLIDLIMLRSRAGAVVTLRGYFAKGTDFTAARSLIEANGGSVDAERWDYGTTSVRMSVPVNAIDDIAASDMVMSIEPELRKKVDNMNSAIRSHIDTARSAYGITGKNVKVAVVDGGEVYTEHPDFGGRVTLAETSSKSNHATHVTGTILGSGEGNANAKGMAYEATGFSFNFNDHLSKFYRAVDEFAAMIINNSWGGVIGWDYNSSLGRWEFNDNQYFFGAYIGASRSLDQFVIERNAIVIFSAGNDRNDSAPSNDSYWVENESGGYDEITDDDNPPTSDGPYRCIDPYSSAKNVIAVGATNVSDVMSDFSSWGPCADGRIKPEVVAKGVNTWSTYNNAGYNSLNGTSMAAPVASGGTALLFEQFQNYLGRMPLPHELKGLLICTANDLGNSGPDYTFGFGLLDINKAAEVIERDEDENTIINGSIRKFKKAKRNKPVYYKFTLPAGVDNLRVALVWLDPEGPAAQTIGDIIGRQESVLMNDLDLRLYWIKERKKRTRVKDYEPYVLDPDNPSATAKTGNNKLDNVELVEKSSPKKGDWYIEVSAGTFKDGKQQDFAIIVYTEDGKLSSPVEEVDQPEALQDK